MKCQLCGGTDLYSILDLGDQPICNHLVTAEELSLREPVYPLELYVCLDCWLVQLENKAPKNEVFGAKYNYLSGASTGLIEYFNGFAERIRNRVKLEKTDLIVDIGGNDGTFLNNFLPYCCVLNIEPTPLPAQIARERGVETVEAYFGKRMIKHAAKAKVVSAINVLAHCVDVHDFLEGVKELLAEDGVFISQSHYLPALIEQLEYDTIYHEHLRYYTLTSLLKLYEKHGLHVFDVEINDVYGGSIVVYARKLQNDKPTVYMDKIKGILQDELKYQSLGTYGEFALQVRVNRDKLSNYLYGLKTRGKRIIGVGAPMKASTLLNYCGIDGTTLDYLTEVNPLKFGVACEL